MKKKLQDAVNAIDDVFGEGYAKKNPELVGMIVRSSSIDSAIDTAEYVSAILLDYVEFKKSRI